jgi:hypothetical protein
MVPPWDGLLSIRWTIQQSRPSTTGDHVPSATLRSTRLLAIVAAIAIVLATLVVGLVAAPPADAAQPVPGHTGLVPSTPRTNTPPDQHR